MSEIVLTLPDGLAREAKENGLFTPKLAASLFRSGKTMGSGEDDGKTMGVRPALLRRLRFLARQNEIFPAGHSHV